MNSKERMFNAINCKPTDIQPVVLHWWGVYKFQYYGIPRAKENEYWKISGKQLANIDSYFYETFKPDWFQLTQGPSKYDKGYMSKLESLDSKTAIDEWIEREYLTYEQIISDTMFEHVPYIVDKYGDSVFIAMNMGAPVSTIFDPHGPLGFEEAMIAIIERPSTIRYLLEQMTIKFLDYIKALKYLGCHAFVSSETMVSADLISPSLYEEVVFESQMYFYHEVDKLGLIPITYFLGDINPLLPFIKRLGAKALLIEEPKKGFDLDPIRIKEKLGDEMCLFGNIDSIYTLLKGSRDDVRNAVDYQRKAAANGGFVIANGSPIAFDTPAENIKEMVQYSRRG